MKKSTDDTSLKNPSLSDVQQAPVEPQTRVDQLFGGREKVYQILESEEI